MEKFMGKLTYQEALDKAVEKILRDTKPLNLAETLIYFDSLYYGYFSKKDEKYIREEIIKNK